MKLVLLFDIDGTLIDSGGAGQAALTLAVQELFGAGLPPNVEFRGRTDRGIAGQIFAGLGLEDSDANWRMLAEVYHGFLPDCLVRKQGRVLQGAREWLDRLRQRSDAAVGLVTGNGRTAAEAKLRHFGLLEYFAFGGFGDDHPLRADVARQALADAQRHLAREGLHPEPIWVIGDTPEDVRCARAIGARAAAVCTGGYSAETLAREQPDLVLTDLREPDFV